MRQMKFQPCLHFFIFLPFFAISASGYGSTGSIAGAFGDEGFFCAIDASGKQQVICWNKNNLESSSMANPSLLPSMVMLSGGEGFVCGISSNDSLPYCWNSSKSVNLVPAMFRYSPYAQIAAGKSHVCAVQGFYYSDVRYGAVDCWQILRTSVDGNYSGVPVFGSFFNSSISTISFSEISSGDGFTCGVSKENDMVCWGPNSSNLGAFPVEEDSRILASGRESVCRISNGSGTVRCQGNADEYGIPPIGSRFVSLSAGASHYCGIREDDHGVDCWGNFSKSAIPRGSGFVAIGSSDFTTCGIREDNLVLDCWDAYGRSPPDYTPPLELFSPGTCSPSECGTGMFAYNASALSEPDLTSLCARKDLKICLRCGLSCPEGSFPSRFCSESADRICTDCSLCQNHSCQGVCGLPSLRGKLDLKKLFIIIGASTAVLVLTGWCLIPLITKGRSENKNRVSCLRKPAVEAEPDPTQQSVLNSASFVEAAQVFRLSELKDATHGFKEFNELGRGSFGFVYKATLSNGIQVAVKRANAATIIHTNSRDFESEVEILCNIRHGNIVNLLGYCTEMGERLLVYEYMPHGTLHDHLHGDLSPLDWNLRLKISLQAARGLEYLHTRTTPSVVHGDVKASNILLDSELGARIADFGLVCADDKAGSKDMKSDVYDFGIVLLEVLSGRKVFEQDRTPPGIVDWAVPLIKQGKAAATIDRNVSLPENVEPLLKLAEIAKLTLREDSNARPVMSDVACWLDQIMKIGLMV